MPNPWFRLYSEFADDPKVQTMSHADQRHLIILFCLRCKGQLLETFRDREIAYALGLGTLEAAKVKETFLEMGFIDECWNIVNWNRRQYISDSSTERVRKYRLGLKQNETLQKHCETQTVTVPEADTDTEQKQTNTLASTAIAVPANKGKLLGTLPLNDGTNWEIYSADVNELQPLYPAVDVRQELRSMKGWLIGNPTNRKTKRGIKRFITSWLDKEQDKTKPNGGNKSNGKTDRAIETATKLFNEFENNAGTHGIELLSGSGAN